MFVRRVLSFLVALTATVSVTANSAKCSRPEVRKEWRELSNFEQLAWLAGYKCLANLPSSRTFRPTADPVAAAIPPRNPKASFFDDIVYLHMELNQKIHNTGFFFPWHRYYVYSVQEAMREKCGYTGISPYWDWTKDAADVEHSSMFRDSNLLWGLGGFGDPKNDHEITDGALSWAFEIAYPVPHRLRRQFILQPYLGNPFWPIQSLQANSSFVPAEVKKAVNSFSGNFTAFQIFVEQKQGMHTGPHLIMGGDFGGSCPAAAVNCAGGPKWSSNDPIFFLHHAMIDKVWYDWQAKSSKNAKAFAGGSVQNFNNNGDAPFLKTSSAIQTDGLFPPATIADVMDTTGDLLCYTYE